MKKQYIFAAFALCCSLAINANSDAASKHRSKIIPKHKVEASQDVRIRTDQGATQKVDFEEVKSDIEKNKDKKAMPVAVKQENKPVVNRAEAAKSNAKVSAVKPVNKSPIAKPVQKSSDITKKDGKTYYRGMQIPNDFMEITIVGESVVTKHQAYTYLKQVNPNARLDCSIEEIVDFYWLEAMREGVRPDLAFCQAIHETGFFKFGGDVLPSQNNFCGLGTVGQGAKGVRFKTPLEGARAHIQHLLAYSSINPPKTTVIDPRYKLVHGIRMERGLIDKWYGLNGTWAMGGNYCEKIMTHYQNMLTLSPGDKRDNKIKTKANKEENTNSHRMRERTWKYIEDKK